MACSAHQTGHELASWIVIGTHVVTNLFIEVSDALGDPLVIFLGKVSCRDSIRGIEAGVHIVAAEVFWASLGVTGIEAKRAFTLLLGVDAGADE
jgi:hypothetical protein